MINNENVSLGDLIVIFYEVFLIIFGDEDLASVAAAASINEFLYSIREAEL